MRALFDLLSNRVFVKDVAAEYACYRQGEKVNVNFELVNFEPKEASVSADLEILGTDGQVAYRATKQLRLASGKASRHVHTWNPHRFAGDEYTIRVLLRREGRTVSKSSNGFVVWNDEVARHGPRIGIEGSYFSIDEKPAILMGTNYYESTLGEAMWFRPNVANIARDLGRMSQCGVKIIRPHYHHLKWFKDYLLYHHESLPEFYRGLAGDVSPLPDQRTWRIWDMFIYLSQKYGIVYGGDLFTLVPEEMGDPRGWFGTVEAVYDHRRRPMQKEFLLAIDRRYRNVPGITWDLFNEPYMVRDEAVAQWADDLRSALKADGAQRLITVGGPFHLPSAVDYDCPHGRLPATFRNHSSRPVLLQELHCDEPEPLAAEMRQAEEFRSAALTTLYVGGAGWMPWSWTRQMRLWQDSFEPHRYFQMEKWDDRLGMHTHEDGTLKPAGLAFKDLAVLLAGIRPKSYDPDTHKIATTAGTLSVRLAAEKGGGNELLYSDGARCLACLAKNRIVVDGKPLIKGPADAYIYLRT